MSRSLGSLLEPRWYWTRQDFATQWQREQEEWLRNAFENLNDGGDSRFDHFGPQFAISPIF